MADGLPDFDLGLKDCRVIADGLASLWAWEKMHGASKRRLKYIDQLGVLFETYAPPRRKVDPNNQGQKRSKKLVPRA